MKNPCLIIFFLLCICKETLPQSDFPTRKIREGDVMEWNAYTRLLKRDLTYAITGEATPTGGLKIDVSKPEATINGYIPSKNIPFLFTILDFKGGVTDNNFAVFTGKGKLSTAFEAKLNFNFIIPNKFLPNRQVAGMVRAKNMKFINTYPQAVLDTFRVLSALLKVHIEGTAESTQLFGDDDNLKRKIYKNEDESKPRSYYVVDQEEENQNSRKASLGAARELIEANRAGSVLPTSTEFLKLMKEITKKYFKTETMTEAVIDAYANTTALLNAIPRCSTDITPKVIDYTKFKDKLYDDYVAAYKTPNQIMDALVDYQIKSATDVYAAKNFVWLSISPFGRVEKNNFYEKYTLPNSERDTNIINNVYDKFGGASVYLNYLRYQKRISFYLKAGGDFMKTNNLTTLSSFNYQIETPFFTNGSSTYTKTKEGTAYNYKDYKRKGAAHLAFEGYILPRKNFIPGFYTLFQFKLGNLYNLTTVKDRKEDKAVVAWEGGLVFNVNHPKKDESVVAISPYVRFEDISDRERTNINDEGKEVPERRKDFLERNFIFGLKVGVPIKIKQAKDKGLFD